MAAFFVLHVHHHFTHPSLLSIALVTPLRVLHHENAFSKVSPPAGAFTLPLGFEAALCVPAAGPAQGEIFQTVRKPMIATNKPNRALAVLHKTSCMDMHVLNNFEP